MSEPSTSRPPEPVGEDRAIRRSSWLLSISFFVLGIVTLARLVAGDPKPIDWLLGILVIASGVAVALHRSAVSSLEIGRRTEAESFARVLRGLSRSISPDAIVDAIVEELGIGTGADHTVVVRLRPESDLLEATLVSQRAGVPSSTTILPRSDLDDPGANPIRLERVPVAIPVGSAVGSTVGSTVGSAVGSTVGWAGASTSGSVGGSAETAMPSSGRAAVPIRRVEAEARRRNSSDRRAETATDRRRSWPVLGAAASARTLGPGAGAAIEAGPAIDGSAADRSSGVSAAIGAGGPSSRIATRIAARVRDVYGLKHTIEAPLVTASGTVGAIVLSRRNGDPWPASAERILAGAAVEASAALERAYSHRAAEARASTDALTGLPNRRYFDEFCGLLARRRRADDAIGVLMIDIDHFKRLNDTHGHATGDLVLRTVAKAIAAAVRTEDVPARFGGEEFAVLLRDPSPTVAAEIGERVRVAVAALDLDAVGGSAVTVSVGVALSVAPDEPIEDVIGAADRALYAAKRGGRNRVVLA